MRFHKCTCVHCTGYGASAVYSSSLVSCPFCVWSAAESHVGGNQSPPNPKGVTPAAARTILFIVLPMRSCREGPEHFDPTLLAFFGLASSQRVTPFSRVTRGHQPFRPLRRHLGALTLPPFEAAPEGTNPPQRNLTSVREITRDPSAPIGAVGPPLPLESLEKGDQKLYLQPTYTTQDVVTSLSGSAMKRAAERPPVTAKGVPEQKKTGSRVGARSPPCALRVPMSPGNGHVHYLIHFTIRHAFL